MIFFLISRGVGPVCLPFTRTANNGNVLTAIGFGATQYAMSASADTKSWILQKVSLTVDNTLGSCSSNANKMCTKGAATSLGTRDTCQV